MTVIAYKNRIMAADSMVLHCDRPQDVGIKRLNCRKIIKRAGYLIGVSGDATPSIDFFSEWFFNEDLGYSTRDPMRRGMKFVALVVRPDGVIELWDETGTSYPPDTPFYAVGSGQEYALGAMAAGASARKAAKIAADWSPSCGGKIVTRSL